MMNSFLFTVATLGIIAFGVVLVSAIISMLKRRAYAPITLRVIHLKSARTIYVKNITEYHKSLMALLDAAENETGNASIEGIGFRVGQDYALFSET